MNALRRLAARLENAASVTVLGRGPSARFVDPAHAADAVVGYNLVRHRGQALDFVFVTTVHLGEVGAELAGDSRSRRPADVMIAEQDVEAALGRDFAPLRVGSITFGLVALLTWLGRVRRSVAGDLEVRLVGFDFRAASADDDVEKKWRGSSVMQRKVDVTSQADVFFGLRRTIPGVKCVHYGFDARSDADPRAWPARAAAAAGRVPVEIVAEITTNHFGDEQRLLRLIEGAAASGADSVKLQMRDVETFYSPEQLAAPYESPFGRTFGDYRRALELTDEQIAAAESAATRLGLGLFFSALDAPSLDRLMERGHRRVKLPSTISRKREFLQMAARRFQGDVVISTGMTDSDYEAFVLREFHRQKRVYLLHCISAYPAWPGDLNLAVVARYAGLEPGRIVPGYSSHDVGIVGSVLAVGAGARMLEKHVKVGVTEWAHFDDTALDVGMEFADYVAAVRASERMLGSPEKHVLPCEHHKY